MKITINRNARVSIILDDKEVVTNKTRFEALRDLYDLKGQVDLKFRLGKIAHSEAIRLNREIFDAQNALA